MFLDMLGKVRHTSFLSMARYPSSVLLAREVWSRVGQRKRAELRDLGLCRVEKRKVYGQA